MRCSILGPILWNILYDGLLNVHLPISVILIDFADNVVIIVKASENYELKRLSMVTNKNWLFSVEFELAKQKTEALVIIM